MPYDMEKAKKISEYFNDKDKKKKKDKEPGMFESFKEALLARKRKLTGEDK